MDLQILIASLDRVLEQREMSLVDFAVKHSIPSSWLYKFKNGKAPNPRYRRLNLLQAAIEAEASASH